VCIISRPYPEFLYYSGCQFYNKPLNKYKVSSSWSHYCVLCTFRRLLNYTADSIFGFRNIYSRTKHKWYIICIKDRFVDICGIVFHQCFNISSHNIQSLQNVCSWKLMLTRPPISFLFNFPDLCVLTFNCIEI
jgi:hypothetical protein